MNTPDTIQEVYIKLANDVKSQLESTNPFKNKSLTKAELTAFAGRIYDVYTQLLYMIDQCFDDTRTGEYLSREGADYGLSLKEAGVSSGYISVVGIEGTTIDDESELEIEGLKYKTDGEGEITEKTLAVTLTYTATTVTATFAEAHNLGNGQSMTISGASLDALNGEYTVLVIDSLTVTYEKTTGETGSDSASGVYDNAVIEVVSMEAGVDYNKNQGEILEFSVSIDDVTAQAVVTVGGLTGGTDIEDDEDFRDRLQTRKKNPSSHFNSSEVESILRGHALVDRVYIERVTPQVGEATIYFMKDDYEIPSAADVETVEDYFEDYLPINDDSTNIHIYAPTGTETDFVFSTIGPDTVAMRTAIENNLRAWFEDNVVPNQTVLEDEYRGVIINTVDPLSLQKLTAFTLTEPDGDLAPSSGYMVTVGDVTI